MIKDGGSKYGDCSISSKIRQVLLPWAFKLTKKYIFINSTNNV